MRVYGDRIRKLREQRGWSLQDLAERCHLSRTFLHDIEKRGKAPSIESLERIAQALGVSTAYLLGETDDPAPPNIDELLDRAKKGDQVARDMLIEHFLPLVAQAVRSIDVPPGVETKDLISIGVVGLVRGLDSYDPARGIPVREYLLRRIRCEIEGHLRAISHSWRERVQELLERQAIPLIPIPIFRAIRADDPSPYRQEVVGWTAIPSYLGGSGEFFALQVRGDSMMGGKKPISDGDVVIVRRQSWAPDGQVALVLWPGTTEAQLRRIYQRGDSVILYADNQAYPPEIVPVRDLTILGVVVGIQTMPAAAEDDEQYFTDGGPGVRRGVVAK